MKLYPVIKPNLCRATDFRITLTIKTDGIGGLRLSLGLPGIGDGTWSLSTNKDSSIGGTDPGTIRVVTSGISGGSRGTVSSLLVASQPSGTVDSKSAVVTTIDSVMMTMNRPTGIVST